MRGRPEFDFSVLCFFIIYLKKKETLVEGGKSMGIVVSELSSCHAYVRRSFGLRAGWISLI